RFSRDWSSDVCSSDLKIFHHTGDFKALNVGKLVIYFDKTPQMEMKKIKRTGFVYEYICEFEDTIFVSPEIEDSIKTLVQGRYPRSEERRVGKECRSLW